MLPLLNVEKSVTNSSLRVMIVDDQEIFRHGLRNLLNDVDGFDVVAEASSCSDVLKNTVKMPIDVALIDSSLPEAHGIGAIQLFRHLTPTPQVVILSTVVDDDTLLDAILAGASGYLTKDLPAKDVINALQGLQRGELAISALAAANVIRRLVKRYNDVETALRTHLQSIIPTNSLARSNISSAPASASNGSSDNFFNSALNRLTQQEYKILQLMRQGLSNKQIATRISISPYTVAKHVQHILRKLEATNRTQAVSYTSFGGHPDLY